MKIPVGNGIVSNRQTSTGQVSTIATSQAESNFNSVSNIINTVMDQRAEKEAQDARNELVKMKNDLSQKYVQNQGDAAKGITEKGFQDIQNIERELTSKLSMRAKNKFGDFGQRVGEDFRVSLMNHERQEEQKAKLSSFNNGVTLAEEMVRTDARNWRNAFGHLDQTLQMGVNSGLIRPEEFETKKTELTNQFRASVGKSYYTQNKHEFMKQIDQFGFGKPEIEAYKQKYQNDLLAEQREKKSLFAEEAKLIFAKRDDMKAQAVANEDTSHYFENAERLEKMGYSAWAKELREEGNQYNSVVKFNSENKNRPLKEVVDAARNLQVGDGLDGSSSQFKANQAIQKEVAKRTKLFLSDPAEYVSSWAQGTTMEEIASSRLSLQEAQGIYPEKGIKVLTESEKKNFKGAWETGDNKQKTDLVLNSFRYGKHTSKVLEEVGVNNALALAPLLKDEKDVELLVSGVASKAEILDDEQKNTYRIPGKQSEFYGVLLKVQSKFPTNDGLAQKIADIDQAMLGISAKHVDPEAGAKFFDERFKTVEASDKLVFFPANVDEDEVEETLDRKKDEIISKYKTGDTKKDNLSKWAIRDATWVNTSNGFVLMDSRSGRSLPGSEIDILEIDTLRKDLVKAKAKQANDLVTKK